MAIKTGRYGQIRFDPTGVGSPSGSIVSSLNKWKLDNKKDKQKVTCFGDENHVYVMGLVDLTGNVNGFWNSTNVVLWAAAESDTPGYLELAPNSQEPTFYWKGPAYFDASIDCSVEGAPTVSYDFVASGSWDRLP